MRLELGRVIAERELVGEKNPRRRLIVRLGTPRPDRDDWVCPYQLLGFGRRAVRGVFGVDAFQALTLALQVIRAELVAIEQPLQWTCGLPGDTGFGLVVHSFIGPAATERIEKMAEREALRFLRRGAARARRAATSSKRIARRE
jgi:hypothetical protein